MLHSKMTDLAEHLGELPTLPGIAIKILEMVKKDETNLDELGEILSHDPPLSAKVLKVANSPLYGLQGKIASVPHAVKLLGMNTIKNLALSFSIVNKFNSQKKNSFDYPKFWKDSLIAAVSSKLIISKIIPELEEDGFFLGLLHDIGLLVNNECAPDQFNLVLKDREITNSPFFEAEDEILGFNHMEIGSYLLEKWELPKSLCDSIRFHHYPDNNDSSNEEQKILTRILHLSSLFIDFFNHSDKGMSFKVLEFYIEKYKFSDTLKIDEIAEDIHRQTIDVFPLFDIKNNGNENFEEILEEAKKELFNLSNDLMKKVLEQQKIISELKKQAMRDSLTNLLNYRAFHEFLESELYRSKRYDRPLSLLMADIDDFKKINDTYGHVAGDHVLFNLAGLITETFRESDFTARYGGEEFAVILPDTDQDGAFSLSERFRERVESLNVDYEGTKINITLSIGITVYDSDKDISKIALVKKADDALYQAKGSGKNRCCLS